MLCTRIYKIRIGCWCTLPFAHYKRNLDPLGTKYYNSAPFVSQYAASTLKAMHADILRGILRFLM